MVTKIKWGWTLKGGKSPPLFKMQKQTQLKNYNEKFDWHNYNKSQTKEKTIFLRLLHELCELLDTDLDNEKGRHSGNDAHKIFCMCIKTYLNTSARRVISDLRMCKELGYLKSVSHFNTVLNYFNDKTITKILKYLIELSAKPLAQLERSFAIDASGIGLRSYLSRWSNVRQEFHKHKNYKKIHVIFGTLTNVATTCIVTQGHRADSPHFQHLLKRTVDNFEVKEVSADLAYSAKDNIRLCEQLNVNPYIPFKRNCSGKSRGCMAWKRAYNYFKDNRAEFLRRYHLRSNSESGFFMIKNKFGGFVRSKNNVAQENEILTKILCHNITILIQELFLHNIEINFLESQKVFVAQK